MANNTTLTRLTREEVFERIQEVLITALAVEKEEVTLSATISGDLGAESIDYLDIAFQLEKAFFIKIPRHEMQPTEIFSSERFVVAGKFTSAGITELKRRIPFTDLSYFDYNPDVENFSHAFTVQFFVDYICHRLGIK